MTTLDVAAAGARLAEMVGGVSERGDRVVLAQGGVPVAALVSLRDLRSLEETVALLSDRDCVRFILEAEEAIQRGEMLAGSDLELLDPSGRFARPAMERAGTASVAAPDRWELIVSVPARRRLEKLPGHVSDAVVRFLFERLVVDPARMGVELRGTLSRRFCAQVETEAVIYRLDSVKQSIRVIEVFHRGGLVGQPMDAGRRW
jgi:prevent-host-death family protein